MKIRINKNKVYKEFFLLYINSLLLVDLIRRMDELFQFFPDLVIVLIRNSLYIAIFFFVICDSIITNHKKYIIIPICIYGILLIITVLITPKVSLLIQSEGLIFLTRCIPGLYFGMTFFYRIDNIKGINKYYLLCLIYIVVNLFYRDITTELTYMNFSYNILFPLCILFFSCFIEKEQLFKGILSLIFLLAIVIMGARGPLLVFFLSVLLWFFIHFHNSKQKKYIFLLLSMGGIAIIFKEKTIEMLFQLFPNSRTLLLLESGMLFDFSGRDRIYQNLLDNLQKNFILPHGLYSDRILLGDGHVDISGYYAHNLFYEVLYQFGGIIGSGLILIFIILILISIREILYCRNEIFIIMYVTFFGGITMLFFSSSYLINERFWLIIGAIISSVFLMKNKASHIPRKSMNNRMKIQNKIQ